MKFGCSSLDCVLVDNRGKGGNNNSCRCLYSMNKETILFVEKKLRRARFLEDGIKQIGENYGETRS